MPLNIPTGDAQERLQFYKQLQNNPLASASTSFVASIVLIIVLFMTAIQPTVKIITQLRDDIEKLEVVNTKLEKKIDSLNDVVPEYRKLGSTVDLINSALPNNHEFPSLERQVRYLITKNNLTLNSLNISGFPVVGDANQILQNKNTALQISTTLGDQSQIMYITVNINLTGEYTVMKSFINDFQKLLRVTTIDQMVMQGDKKTKGAAVEMSLKGNVYYLSESAAEE